MNLLHLLSALTLTLTVISCQGQTNTEWKIDIGIQNIGTNMLDATSVTWGEFTFIGGFVSPSNKAVHVSFDHPIPDTATVKYSLSDNKGVTKTLAVKTIVPAAAYQDKDMTVMFVVNSNTDEVTVKFLHFIQKDGYSQLVPFENSGIGVESGRVEGSDLRR